MCLCVCVTGLRLILGTVPKLCSQIYTPLCKYILFPIELISEILRKYLTGRNTHLYGYCCSTLEGSFASLMPAVFAQKVKWKDGKQQEVVVLLFDNKPKQVSQNIYTEIRQVEFYEQLHPNLASTLLILSRVQLGRTYTSCYIMHQYVLILKSTQLG